MDHLPHPENPYEPIQVPYLAGEDFDNLEFSTFPDRKGWTSDKLLARLKSDDATTRKGDVRSALAFIQSWLFFGTLNAIFGKCGIAISKDDYVESGGGENGDAIISTKSLLSHIAKYLEVEKTLPESTRIEHRNWINKHMTAVCIKAQRFDIESNHNEVSKVIFSIVVLCTSLNHFLFGHPFTAGPSKILGSLMAQKGWCRYQVAMVNDNFFEASRYFIYLLGPPRVKKDHNHCTKSLCAANQLDEATYKTKHVQNSCTCGAVEPDLEKIISITGSDGIPLISFSPPTEPFDLDSSDLDCRVEEFEPGMPYVAFSHVWSDGLGNTTKNDLPRCQMKSLRARGWNLIPAAERDSQTRVRVWIDTLCVPLRPNNAKKAAIASMRRIYMEATWVLVLDAELMQTRRPLSMLETRMRIVTSAWFSRLWTYQEGVLARSLQFQFSGEAVSGQELFQDELRSEQDKISVGVSSKHLVWSYPRSSILGPGTLTTKEGQFTLLEGLRWRSTTKIRDEPICLSVLLGLDLAQIMTYPEDERFKVMLNFQREFRVGMLFYRGPRMREYRYRWSPLSFMNNTDPIPFGQDPAYFTWHSWGFAGLTFRSVGLSFGPVSLPATTTRFTLGLPWEEDRKVLRVDCEGDQSYNFLRELAYEKEPTSFGLIIGGTILGPIAAESPPASGALVLVLKKENLLFTRFLCCVSLTRLAQALLGDEESCQDKSIKDIDMGMAEIVPYQWWCVG